MDDTIYRQAVIDRINKQREHLQPDIYPQDKIGDAAYRICAEFIERLPSAQPEISRIEQELHGKTPEEQYEFLYWLMFEFALTYTDSRLAVVEWLRGGKEDA